MVQNLTKNATFQIFFFKKNMQYSLKKIRLVIWLQRIAPIFSNFRPLCYLSIPLFAPLEEKKHYS